MNTNQTTITSDNVNLTNCEQEQIHIPNSIQPHGTLIIVDKTSWEILQTSDNTEVFLGFKPSDLINFPLTTILKLYIIKKIKACLEKDFAAINPIRVKVNNKPFNLIVHNHQGFIFLEFEPIIAKYKNDFFTFYNITRTVIDEIQSSKNIQELSEAIVHNIREITGFDRVMVYRFDEDDSGNVIAEAKEAELDSLYGLRYPAIDISNPARKLFLLNYIRLIPDIDYQPVPLPKHPQTQEPFDLSYCSLRSVSPCHLEYLTTGV